VDRTLLNVIKLYSSKLKEIDFLLFFDKLIEEFFEELFPE